jgi:uncharacterized membrane protein
MKKLVSKVLGRGKLPTAGVLQREKRELRRLESLIDGVFALVIVLVTLDLPPPVHDTAFNLADFLASRFQELSLAALAIVVILVYWFQNNLLLGNLARTDGKHAALSVFQVFLLLLYLLAVSLGIQVGNEPLVLATQSAAAALLGFVAAAAWWYASHGRRLLTDEIDDSEIAALRLRVLAEPLTATLTLALAFVGPLAWELGWFAYPLVALVLRRLGLEYAQDPPPDQVSDPSVQQ